MRWTRVIWRSGLMLALLLAAMVDGQVRKWLGVMTPGPEGAVWVHGWCRRIVRALGIVCEIAGPVPDARVHGERGMLAVVSNHMSYLDVLVYSATRPFVMVSKTEVRGWPLIGWITAQAGTIYVKRGGGEAETAEEMAARHAKVNAQMAAAYRSGLLVLFFPEGTTTDGSEIVPFRRGLYNSVVYDEVPVRVAAMKWELREPNAGASVAEDVCFVGDAEFGPHLLRFLGLRGVTVKVRFGNERVRGEDRFALAANSREMMVEMWEGLGSGQEFAAAEGAEDVFDGPVDGLGAVYGDGGVRG